MKIHNLRDLKNALNKVPDNVLGHFVVSSTEDGELGLGCTKGEDEGEMGDNYQKMSKTHSQIKHIDGFFRLCGEECEKEEHYPVEYNPEVKK